MKTRFTIWKMGLAMIAIALSVVLVFLGVRQEVQAAGPYPTLTLGLTAQQPIVPVNLRASPVPGPQYPGDLAWNKPVFASSYWKTAYPANVTNARYWESAGSTGTWLYIDLGQAQNIHEIINKSYVDERFTSQPETYYITSNDLNTWQIVVDEINTHNASNRRKTRTHTLPYDVTARYVGIYAANWSGGWGDTTIFSVFSNKNRATATPTEVLTRQPPTVTSTPDPLTLTLSVTDIATHIYTPTISPTSSPVLTRSSTVTPSMTYTPTVTATPFPTTTLISPVPTITDLPTSIVLGTPSFVYPQQGTVLDPHVQYQQWSVANVTGALLYHWVITQGGQTVLVRDTLSSSVQFDTSILHAGSVDISVAAQLGAIQSATARITVIFPAVISFTPTSTASPSPTPYATTVSASLTPTPSPGGQDG